MAYYSSTTTPLQRPSNGYTETSSFYGVHIPSNIKRRKRSPPHPNWAKFATKCVVASPLIVLVLWSVAVMAHSSSSSSSHQNIASSTARTSTKALVVEPSRQGGNNRSATSSSSLPVYVPLGQQQSSSGSTIVVRPRPHPRGLMDEDTQGGNAMTTAASQNVMTVTTVSDENAMQNGVEMKNTQNEIAVMANENAQNGMQNGVMLMNTQGGNAMTTTTTTTPYGNNAMTQQQGVMTTTTPLGDNVITAFEIAENVLGNAAITNLKQSHPKKVAKQNVHPARKTTRILYYDPAVGTETVYDADGTPILLSSLQTDTTEIYLERPPSPAGALEQQQQQHPVETLEYEWGESQAQDQMIIISTVATMALLVGALSARRMRSRQFLASCIENESLEDEIAYDTAYTTNGYDTFGGGPWKGDLEKFDV